MNNLINKKKSVLLCLFFGFILPQTVLVCLNLRSWTLISGEANQQQWLMASGFLIVSMLLIVIEFIIFFKYRNETINISFKIALASLIAHILYMWLFLFFIPKIIPETIQPWIVSAGNVGRWSFTLFMPGAFLSLYMLTKYFFLKKEKSIAYSIAFLAPFLMPILFYLLVTIAQPLGLGQFGIILGIIIATLMVITFLGSIIYLFDNFFHKNIFTDFSKRYYIITCLLGIVAPLGGLILNRTISFPVDFQSINVYLLTIINGAVLLIRPKSERFILVILFLRCLTLPFILYFFLVFLPFLPLSLIAIIGVGVGFLMLTPLALGLYQFRITWQEVSFAALQTGFKRTITVSLLGLLILPGYFFFQAIIDKKALNKSLNYFYSYDFSDQSLSEKAVNRAAKTLVQLRDRKLDIQLPYISGFYNQVVFGNLVLSDTKIERIYKLLTDKPMPEPSPSFIGTRKIDSSNRFRARIIAPDTNVDLSNISISSEMSGSATMHLTMKNNTEETHSLFTTHLNIPDGVFISSLRLKIENEWVTGQIFDKKTALWVFQKITEVRNDPALLYYLSQNTLELRVYPFPSKGIREVEIDFAFHPDIRAEIQVADKTLNLNSDHQYNNAIITHTGGIVSDRNIHHNAFSRTPYIHFILDYSKNSKLTELEYAEKIIEIKNKLDIPLFQISAANIEMSSYQQTDFYNTSNPDQIETYISNINLPRIGGLCIQKALAHNIIQTNQRLNDKSFQFKSVFVVLGGNTSIEAENIDFDAWKWLIPDMDKWFIYSEHELIEYSFHQYSEPIDSDKNLVFALKQGNKISILPSSGFSIYESESPTINIFSPSKDTFEALNIDGFTAISNDIWLDYVQTWKEWQTINLVPANIENKRNELLKKSKDLNLLIPTTSYIVVENLSHWEILKRKESQSIENHSALDFEEEQKTSEPHWLLMLLGLFIYILYKEKRKFKTG